VEFAALPLVFSWPYAIAFWAVYVWSIAPEMRLVWSASRSVARAREKTPDAGSFQLLVVMQAVALAAAFALAFLSSTRFAPAYRALAFWSGLVLVVAGTLLRSHCRCTLGKYFTADVRAESDQPVVDTGAYRWIRHPSYTGGLLIFTGVGLALGSWASALVMFGSTLGAYLYRMPVEERALTVTLGEKYQFYMRSHKRLVPYIY
jgi:protein-S-isoprenylcysteine O-methyltransferase Ste14